jgi:hypothetical protein
VRGLPHYVVRKNGHGYFQPPRDVRAFIEAEACGPDGPRARARAKKLARGVEKKRQEIKRAMRTRKQARTLAAFDCFDVGILDIGTFARNYLANVGTLSERHAASVCETVPRFVPRGPPGVPAGAIMPGADVDW